MQVNQPVPNHEKTNREPAASVPPSPMPESDLLEDLVKVWGAAVGVDEATARALILTVVGGVAGNSVRINAPRVGELGADLQIAVDRDKAPGLRRGMQRLLSGYESTILSMLNRYEHLSTRRAQKQELSLLETELRMIRREQEQLAEIVGNEKKMMDLTLKKQAEQVISRFDALDARSDVLEEKLSALIFRMRPMVMVSELNMEEIGAFTDHAFDNSLLEVVATPGYLGRLALMPDRWLHRLASFRRSSGWASRLEFANGEYRRRSTVSTVLLAGGEELTKAWSDRMISITGLLDEMLVCVPSEAKPSNHAIPDPGDRWAYLVDRLFARRLKGDPRTYQFTPEAGKRFEKVRKELLKLGEEHEGALAILWREYGPALVAKLALCATLMRGREDHHVGLEDLETAISLAMHLLESTAMHQEKVNELVTSRRRIPHAMVPAPAEAKANPTTRMIQKLKRIGPCTMRTLFRNYPRSRYDLLQPVLERAIELGLVVTEGKLLRVVESCEEAALPAT